MKQIRVGLTGNIGSGKTTVSKIFNSLGAPIFNSDLCAREMETIPYYQNIVKELVGEDVYPNGVLDKERFRKIIFNDKSILSKMNQVTTPYVKGRFEDFCVENSDKPILGLESAILFELNVEDNFDYTITVVASEKTRISRVLKRDNSGIDMVKAKMNNQMSETIKIDKSNFIIVNDGYDLLDSIPILTKQIKTIIDVIK